MLFDTKLLHVSVMAFLTNRSLTTYSFSMGIYRRYLNQASCRYKIIPARCRKNEIYTKGGLDRRNNSDACSILKCLTLNVSSMLIFEMLLIKIR